MFQRFLRPRRFSMAFRVEKPMKNLLNKSTLFIITIFFEQRKAKYEERDVIQGRK